MPDPRILLLLLTPLLAGACYPQDRMEAETHSAAPGRTAEDFDTHVEALREKLPHGGFHVVVQPPFVVIGDQDPRSVERWAERTVKWAVDHLKAEYFPEDPEHILDVWLFKDKASYEKHARELFGRRPHTPFGYYSAAHRALVMNIATGGGTLVHEIVHPFVEANFPNCPAWFNEGLGSLYEQCAERNERIVGLTNWRLKGLQEAIRTERVPTLEELTGTTSAEFYGDGSGLRYAMARYLLYHLQEQGLLQRYYRAFHAARDADPTGYETLKKILGRDDMEAFQQEWQEFVLGLRYG